MPTPWWHPDAYSRRRPHLLRRMEIIRAIRRWFEARDFVEVETPALQVSPGMEPHIMAFATWLEDPLGAPPRSLYLHTSPEFAMKKLLVAGERRLFQIARCFRNAEISPRHQPEFTMLEWYRAGAGLDALMADCEALMRAAGPRLRHGDSVCDVTQSSRRLTVAEAFLRYAGIDLLATAPDPLAPDRALLAAEAGRIGISVRDSDSWEDLFFKIMLDRIEPHLGHDVPCFLTHYPVSLAALARRSPEDARVAERFELYVCGVELANAFVELTDAAEQRRRFEADMALKERLYGVFYPIDEEFMAALAHGMPDCAGIALGVDRLAMLAAGVDEIGEVLWAPV